jgi:hypothetical protein
MRQYRNTVDDRRRQEPLNPANAERLVRERGSLNVATQSLRGHATKRCRAMSGVNMGTSQLNQKLAQLRSSVPAGTRIDLMPQADLAAVVATNLPR